VVDLAQSGFAVVQAESPGPAPAHDRECMIFEPGAPQSPGKATLGEGRARQNSGSREIYS